MWSKALHQSRKTVGSITEFATNSLSVSSSWPSCSCCVLLEKHDPPWKHMIMSLPWKNMIMSLPTILGWLSLESTIHYHTILAMHEHAVSQGPLSVIEPTYCIQFGTQYQYHTRTTPSFASIYHHRLSCSKKSFRGKETMWSYSLPVKLTDSTPDDFMNRLLITG